MVACAAPLGDDGPVRIGLPLDGWSLAVVDAEGQPRRRGRGGRAHHRRRRPRALPRPREGRREVRAHALPRLGSGLPLRRPRPLRRRGARLPGSRRRPGQGRRPPHRARRGRDRAAGAAGRHRRGGRGADDGCRRARARRLPRRARRRTTSTAAPRARRSRERLPSAIVPAARARRRAARPHLGQGRSRRAARGRCPGVEAPAVGFTGTEAWLAEQWQAVLGMPVPARSADFFDLGGGSLAAAQLVSRIRTRVPGVLGRRHLRRAAARGDGEGARRRSRTTTTRAAFRQPEPTPRSTQWVQTLVGIPLFILTGIRWLLYLLTASALLHLVPGLRGAPDRAAGGCSSSGCWSSRRPSGAWRSSVVVRAACCSPGSSPGDHPRGGATHLRLWLAEQIADQVDAVGLAGAPWVTYYARALGAKIGRDVDLHTLPPITGHARDRRPRGDRARGRPPRLLDRRRPAAPRRGPHRRRRHDRRAEHARPGNPHRPARRDRARIGGVRPRARRPVVGGLARRARRRRGRRLAGRASARTRGDGCGPTPRRRRSSACCRSRPSRSAASSSRRASAAPTRCSRPSASRSPGSFRPR